MLKWTGKDAVIEVQTAEALQDRMLLSEHIMWIGDNDYTLEQLLRLPIQHRQGGTFVGFHTRKDDQPLTNLCVLFCDDQFGNHPDGFRDYYRSVVETYSRWAKRYKIPAEYDENTSIEDAQWDILSIVGLVYARKLLFREADRKGGVQA